VFQYRGITGFQHAGRLNLGDSGAPSMTDSLGANEDADLEDRFLDEWSRPGSGGTLATRVGGCHLIDVSETGHFPTLSPHRKVLLLSLLLSLKDRATELRFEPRDTDLGVPAVRVSYVVNGEVYDLVPPPFETAIKIIQEIKELAGLPVLRRRTPGIWGVVADWIARRSTGPTYGGFRVGAGDQVSEITVMVQPSPRGDRVLMQISRVDPAMARIAEENLRRLFANRRNSARKRSAEGPSAA
jgi:hypothetical protein